MKIQPKSVNLSNKNELSFSLYTLEMYSYKILETLSNIYLS